MFTTIYLRDREPRKKGLRENMPPVLPSFRVEITCSSITTRDLIKESYFTKRADCQRRTLFGGITLPSLARRMLKGLFVGILGVRHLRSASRIGNFGEM